jgi:Alr-MurF fusion protein
MNFSDLKDEIGGEVVAFAHERPLSVLLTDSRKPVVHEGSIFFAISGERNDGHHYICRLYESGVRQFVVEKDFSWEQLPAANAIRVLSSVDALQRIAAFHRQQFSLPVIGITGSNGKTIIKEWLFQLLSFEYDVIKNPGSYNSQIGVPLSVWQIQPHNQLGIFEAGISKSGEMEKLQRIIRPTLGIFANIGTAHDENFPSRKDKISEKMKLFSGVDTLIYCSDHLEIDAHVKSTGMSAISWGTRKADILITQIRSEYRVTWKDSVFHITLPFTDMASTENAMHCVAVMLVLGYDPTIIQRRILILQSIPMRLELKEGINHCQIIDDTYNNDLGGLQISLEFLSHQHQSKQRTLILSDILQSGLPDDELVRRMAAKVNAGSVTKLIGIGPILSRNSKFFSVPSSFFNSTDEFLMSKLSREFRDEILLVKGARSFAFERIVKHLQRKVHGTVMEINLSALIQNLNFFKSILNPGTRVMVMVKAFAYGSGSAEIANVLQFHQVDYLGVAYADEGVELRQKNISIPIMVMNPTSDAFQTMLEYSLEPEIFGFKLLKDLVLFLDGNQIWVHLKLDTGMHRLGFEESDTEELIALLRQHPNIRIASMFTHLSGADDEEHDTFSKRQGQQFLRVAEKIKSDLGINPMLHVLNTPGILRLPELQMDMVRLGIGLYGVDPSGREYRIKPVATLKTLISQIRKVKKGDTIGYGREGMAISDMQVATIAIGYADGYSRAFSQGVGEVLVNGRRAKVVGNVCMDMTMIDVTDINVKEGDEVTIFGEMLPIQEVASKINTIPYEILTNTGNRVKRIFVTEGI